jgi:prepilin-type N-terminal cleavage/methylation domain-containing protein
LFWHALCATASTDAIENTGSKTQFQSFIFYCHTKEEHIMIRTRNAQAGFTLVELLIVVIIVAILASVAIPLYRGVTESAYAREADGALGTIRSTMRTVQSQSAAGDFSAISAKYTADLTLKITDVSELNLDATDLLGNFFDGHSYRMTTLTAATYLIKAIGDSSRSGKAASVAGIIRTIDQNGTLASE